MREPRDVADSIVTRRHFLRAGALATVTGLAGCGQQGGTETPSPNTNATDAGTDTPDETPGTATADNLDEPVEPVPAEARCAVCNMYAADYPDWNAQATHENGDRAYFCSPGCFTAYHADPGHFDAQYSRDDLANEWVRDYESGAYIDATEAAFVLDEMESHIDAPMGENPVPFDSEENARSYVDEYDSLTREDIVTLSAFDVALARRFSARFLPETDEPSIVEPASVPSDADCAVCEMMPAKFPAWNAQATHEDGDRAYFCSPGCLTTYYADPGHFDDGREQSDIVGVWAHDADTEELIDGTTASYVLDTDAERTGGPMMGNPLPYASESAAQQYVDTYDDLTDGDIVQLQALTREDAKAYRGKFL